MIESMEVDQKNLNGYLKDLTKDEIIAIIPLQYGSEQYQGHFYRFQIFYERNGMHR